MKINLQLIFSIIFIYLVPFTVFSGDFTEDSSISITEVSAAINRNYDALLIVDAWPCDAVLSFLQAVKDAKAKNRPIILVDMVCYKDSDDKTDIKITDSLKDYPHKIIMKDWCSAFYETSLETYLKDMDLRNIFIIGTETDICINDTIEDGIKLGFTFVLSETFFDQGLPNIVKDPYWADRFVIF